MKVIDILNSPKPTISLEVFPPKTDAVYASVEQAVEKIADLKPSYMSVTYGAGGGTSSHTVNIAKHIQCDKGVTAIAHLSCISSTSLTLETSAFKIKLSIPFALNSFSNSITSVLDDT